MLSTTHEDMEGDKTDLTLATTLFQIDFSLDRLVKDPDDKIISFFDNCGMEVKEFYPTKKINPHLVLLCKLVGMCLQRLIEKHGHTDEYNMGIGFSEEDIREILLDSR